MANLTQTAANVGIGSLTDKLSPVQFGEAVTQGQPLYRDADSSKYYQGDASDADKSVISAIALTADSTNGFGVVAKAGSLVDLGATLVVGVAYYLSGTKGNICDESTLGSGDSVTFLGIAVTTSLLAFEPNASGVVKPA